MLHSAGPTRAPHDRTTFRRRLDAAAAVSWRVLVVGALAIAVVWLLARLTVVIIPVLLALFLASVASPPATWLRRRGLPPLLATWVVVLVGLGVVGLFIWFITVQVAAAVDDLSSSVVRGWESFQEWLAMGPFGLGRDQTENLIDQALDALGGTTGQIGSRVVSGVGTATEVVTGTILTVIVAFFTIKDGERLWTWFLSKVSDRRRGPVERAGSTAWNTLRRYLGGTAVVGLVDAVLIGGALAILGVPLVIPLALLVFAGGFFPFVGAVVSGGIATLVTLATNGFTDALIVGAVTLVVQQVEGDVVAPIVMGQAVRLHPLIIILGITIGLIVAGLVGAFLSVPVVAVAAQIVRELRPAWLETS